MRAHHTYLVIYLLLIAITAGLAYRQPQAYDALRNFAFDTFQRLDPPPYDPALPVRVLAVDETSLDRFGQWPWPRTRIATMVRQLRAMGASAVAFDILFAEPDRSSLENVLAGLADDPEAAAALRGVTLPEPNDARLADAVRDQPVVLGATMTDFGPVRTWPPKSGFAFAGDDATPFIPAFRTVVLPVQGLRDAATGLGATNWLPDRDQIVRKVPLFLRSGDAIIPGLAIEALRVAQGASTFVIRSSNASGTTAFGAKTGINAVMVGDAEIATGPSGIVRPRYSHPDPRRVLSAADLFDGKLDPASVNGRIIFVGTTAIGLGDVRATPLDASIPGVEVHAQLLEQLLSGNLLSRPDWALGAESSLTLLCFVVLGLLLPRVPPLMGGILTAWIITLFVLGSWTAFARYAVLIDPAIPSATIAVTYLISASVLWQTERRAKREVRAAFGKYVAPAVVDRIADNPALLTLSGETRNLTILFSDLRNFSTISEPLTAAQVARFLNRYLTPMTDTILRFDGTIDKYIGDAIVAFWNAPLDIPDHTTRAVDAALAMREALVAFNARNHERTDEDGLVLNVRMGVGLNYGACSVGNMGSTQRFDYSALGDPVNVAARLEALTKTYGVDLLATAAVRDRTPGHAWLEIEEVQVKGRSTKTQLFVLAGSPAFAHTPLYTDWAAKNLRMRDASRGGRHLEAAMLAEGLAEIVEPLWKALYQTLAHGHRDRLATDAPEAVSAASEALLSASPLKAELVVRS